MKNLNMTRNSGFTLIELLVVVSILAGLAGMTSVAVDTYHHEAQETITHVEMTRISNAIKRFKIDTGYWPRTEPTDYTSDGDIDDADFSFLFRLPEFGVQEWNIDSAIGWHGPYLDYAAIKTLVIDTINPNKGCAGLNEGSDLVALNLLDKINGLIDRFEQVRENNSGERYCVLARIKNDMDKFKVAQYSASPYLYRIDYPKNSHCDNDNKCIALQSFGPNGIDESNETGLTNEEKAKIDDIVFILQLNKS